MLFSLSCLCKALMMLGTCSLEKQMKRVQKGTSQSSVIPAALRGSLWYISTTIYSVSFLSNSCSMVPARHFTEKPPCPSCTHARAGGGAVLAVLPHSCAVPALFPQEWQETVNSQPSLDLGPSRCLPQGPFS